MVFFVLYCFNCLIAFNHLYLCTILSAWIYSFILMVYAPRIDKIKDCYSLWLLVWHVQDGSAGAELLCTICVKRNEWLVYDDSTLILTCDAWNVLIVENGVIVIFSSSSTRIASTSFRYLAIFIRHWKSTRLKTISLLHKVWKWHLSIQILGKVTSLNKNSLFVACSWRTTK